MICLPAPGRRLLRRVNSHASRNEVLIKTRRYQQIWKHYQPLHDLSRRIRYLAAPSGWVPVEQVQKQIWGRYLYLIEKYRRRLDGPADVGACPVSSTI
jgi:hypothetical protein